MTIFNWSQSERQQLIESAELLSNKLLERGCRIATVESCTGGGVAMLFTEFAGSSSWYDSGFVTYSNRAKSHMVGVSQSTLAQYGAVSEQVAWEMANGGLKHSDAEYSLSITGVAGPDGGSLEKPVGTVCFAWAGIDLQTQVQTRCFQGDRHSVRFQSMLWAIHNAVSLL